MRKIAVTLISAGLVSLAGCGCLETWTPRENIYDAEGHLTEPDPKQPGWQRWVFGVHYVPCPILLRSVPPDANSSENPH